MQTSFATFCGPVALHNLGSAERNSCRREGLFPATAALTGRPPGQRSGNQTNFPITSLQKMFCRYVGPIPIIYFNHMEIISWLRTQKNYWDGKLRDCLPEPCSIIADFRCCPDNPLDLAREKTVYDGSNVLAFRLVQQVQ